MEEYMRNLVLAVAMGICACSTPTTSETERLVGVIGFPNAVVIEHADTVRPGQQFVVSIKTYAPDGCWLKGETDIREDGRTVIITPYDLHLRNRSRDCLQMPQQFIHSANISLVQPGSSQLEFRGRDGTVVRPVFVQ
jgi:hypothetical protein